MESRPLLSATGVGVKGDVKDLTGLTTEILGKGGQVTGYRLGSPDGRFVTYDVGNKTAGRLTVATDPLSKTSDGSVRKIVAQAA